MISLEEAISNVRKAVENFADKKQMGVYARSIAKDIQIRTRLGKGCDDNRGSQKRLKKLTSEKYKKFRQNYSDLHSLTRPTKSNLTLTGELLNSLKGKGTAPQESLIYLEGERNENVAGYQEEQGRIFLRISAPELRKITRQIKSDLEEYMKKSVLT